MSTPCNFFAILTDGSVRKISLTQNITSGIRDVFIDGAVGFLDPDKEPVEFGDGSLLESDEVHYVDMELPESIIEMSKNAINAPILNLEIDTIKTLFWCEKNVYYFQTFDNRKLLRNKNVIFYSKNTYDKLEKDAFVVDNVVHAVHKSKKLYFFSYANANKVFSLIEFFNEASNEQIEEFSGHAKIEMDEGWFKENSNAIIRKHILLLQKSKILDKADTKQIKKDAKKFKLVIELDPKGKIKLPTDKKVCKDVLSFLNEQFYFGLITGNKYRTNSKRDAEPKKKK